MISLISDRQNGTQLWNLKLIFIFALVRNEEQQFKYGKNDDAFSDAEDFYAITLNRSYIKNLWWKSEVFFGPKWRIRINKR